MTDETILRMVEETCKVLSRTDSFVSARHLTPSYDALLQAAKENHPDDRFLGILPTLGFGEGDEITSSQMNVLLAQLRVALESLQPSRRVSAAGGFKWSGSGGQRSARSALGNVDLSGVNLAGARLAGANLMDANLSGANLRDVDLTDANLARADLSGANLRGSKLVGTNLSDADLSVATIRDADLSGLDLSGVNLSGASLSEVDLTDLLRSLGVDLEAGNRPPDEHAAAGSQEGGGEISEADRQRLTRAGVDLSGVQLAGARLEGVDVTGVHWFGANLTDADLSRANLTEADLTGANLSGANLSGTNLSGADLSGATLPGVDLSGLDLPGASLAGATAADIVGLVRRLSAGGENLSPARREAPSPRVSEP